ncbi:Fe-S cluster assembly protein SufD [Candidatus Magnetaquicoccus inordinatus]|uniref:Fe-S cluster assembly protein SufD n=1 Tax=Candidatus Magnetaquicoccus inordinatus TaxID=2496818 RepID=UPI00187D13E2|nr:Fe-S cluster assembly protein SufD [Candidatus Magnetaquicoccus inordinatus]
MNNSLQTYQSQWNERLPALPGCKLLSWRAARQKSMERLLQIGLPTQKMETWKYTSGKLLSQRGYTLPDPACLGLDPEDLSPYLLEQQESNRLVFVNGLVAPFLSKLHDLPPGVRVESLAKVVNNAPDEWEPYLEQFLTGPDQGFSELNHALWADGAFVYLPEGSRLEKPLQLLFLTTTSQNPMMTLPWNLIIAGGNSQAVLVESYATLGQAIHFTNSYTSLVLGDKAQMRHLLLLGESPFAHHVGTLQCTQTMGSRLHSQLFSIGGKITRQDLHVTLAGTEAECSLDGLFFAKGEQHMDFHSAIHHTHSTTRSQQLYKGILDEQARGIFNGLVHVPSGVEQTQSQQTTANLLLSDRAEIDAKPQLEINSNAVQCSHGATVGSLDPEALFYLQSRGIDFATARTLLIHGFAEELLQRFSPASVREWIERSFHFGGVHA